MDKTSSLIRFARGHQFGERAKPEPVDPAREINRLMQEQNVLLRKLTGEQTFAKRGVPPERPGKPKPKTGPGRQKPPAKNPGDDSSWPGGRKRVGKASAR